ncbi:flagellar M-ring protein FliF [Ectothiorhodospira mobilis]|uniref:Flagellar M-ring protein n=1 Tax=Ectothiorhodospira mobilis TaxID=195064 RepID=A0A1I4QI63_ECTMO|nr:flagellar basal-body MS-ring/collar protein FliF [Ectothiorhodospira mobilis]SFM39456.1 flagellar M-ring protein FliF [Ectothiorhodospira mobilis]
MATSLTATLNQQMQGFTQLPKQSQIGLIVGIAAAVALVVSLFIWLTRPEYSILYPDLGQREAGEVMQALEARGIPHKVDPITGALTVPAEQVHEARLQLATEGLPKSSGFGFELMQQEQGIGTSRLVETARYHRALEGELARSIATLSSVESARVHLAMPKESVFVRDRSQPSASVVLTLHPGRTLSEHRVAGIVHLVASSIPDMEPERVTVVDQRGNLLTPEDPAGSSMDLSIRNLEFRRQVEADYRQRIEDLLTPLVGKDGVRAQVSTEMDFSRIERTMENYDPETIALRSEQISEEKRRGGPQDMGIPGALTNQPPDGGELGAEGEGMLEGAPAGQLPVSSSRQATRNYEVDRTVSHVQEAPGAIRRLSVAVVVDFQERVNEDGETVSEPVPPEELDRIEGLVREAVGFNPARGDTVEVVSAPFVGLPEPEPKPEPALWEQPWFQDLARTGLLALVGLLLILLVVRPLMRNLAAQGGAGEAEGGAEGEGEEGMGEDQLSLTHEGGEEAMALPGKKPASYEANLERVRELIKDDPKLVAQVVKNWVAEDGA